MFLFSFIWKIDRSLAHAIEEKKKKNEFVDEYTIQKFFFTTRKNVRPCFFFFLGDLPLFLFFRFEKRG
jgi:hypothetical protein